MKVNSKINNNNNDSLQKFEWFDIPDSDAIC